MNRQYQNPASVCCCGRSEHSYAPVSRYISSRDSSPEEECNYPTYSAPRNNHSYRNNQHYDSRTANNQYFNTFHSGRQQACQYSDMEETSTVNTYCHPDIHESENTYQNSSLLRRANDLINYAPESEFLRKMKQQCQYLHNNRQPNIFSTLNDFVESKVPVYECQKCTDSSAPVSRRGEQLNSDRYKCSTEKSWKCNCNQASNVMDSNDDRAFFRNFANVQRQCREDKTEESFEKNEMLETLKSCKKKSEHVSRSKKPVKCRGRRKRKSDSSEKCESEDQFEPTLKKPHENSCERCWRFASPTRSPVNKPDQKYDPNFRRGHSYMDLEKGSGDLVEKDSEFEKVRPGFVKEKARSLSPETLQLKSAASPQVTKDKFPVVQPPMCNNTKVKELLNPPCPYQKPLENYLSTSLPKGDSPKLKTGGPIGGPECQNMLHSDLGRKPRPKSYSPGLSPPETGRCSNPINNLNLMDYKNICMKPKKQCFDTFDSMNKNKSPPNLMPLSYRETCALRGCNPSGPCDQYNPKPISESPAKKDKCESSKLSSSKTSKTLGDLENKTLKTDSSAQGEPSPAKSTRPSSPPKKTSESIKSDSSKLKAGQKSDSSKLKVGQKSGAGKPKDTKPEKKTEKKPEKKPQKKTPQPPKSKANSDKNRSSTEGRDKVCGGDKEKSQSAGDSLMKEYYFNPAPNCGNTADHNRNSHPIRDCSCYPRVPRSKNDPENQNGHIFCCHCDWGENQDNKGANPCKTSAPARPTCGENDRFYKQNNTESNDRRFMNNSRDYSHTHGSTCPESNFNQSPRAGGIALSCPYREYYNNNRRSNTPENSRCQTWESERRSARDYRYVPGNQNFYSECSPRKYFMFYMTKSDEFKKGDDVEVLVEELAHPCPNGKDTRTKDIAEKMKKIMECPMDSMALRFQKGMSEMYKTPPSSRVLYF